DVFRRPASRAVAEFLGSPNIFTASFSGRTARLPWGRITLPASFPRQEALIFIRPEHLMIAPASRRGKIKGRILSRRDFGQYFELKVAVAPQYSLVAHVPTYQAAGLKKEVFLDWPPDAWQVLPKEELP
ncbi:TOBE domain-containing protein, partial [candidate division FCPU426 bacterium]|nr:TOBE domain-containing protein [candidate division FCPU426 bacterium]